MSDIHYYKSPIKQYERYLIASSSNILIYGFQLEGLVTFHTLEKRGYEITGICCEEHAGKLYHGVPVFREELLPRLAKCIDLIIVANKYYDAICKRLRTIEGFENIEIVSCESILCFIPSSYLELDSYDFDFIGSSHLSSKTVKNYIDLFFFEKSKNENTENEINISTLDLVLTEKCTMKCIECSNLMQYYTNPKNYVLYNLVKPFSILEKFIDRLCFVHLLGGEPFIYSNLPELLFTLSLFDKIDRIKIFTNGTIIPSSELLETLARYDVLVSISCYPVVPAEKRERLVENLKHFRVEYELKNMNSWQHCGYFPVRDTEGLTAKFQECCAQDLLTLQNGRLFRCPFSSNAWQLKAIPQEKEFSVAVDYNLTKKGLYDFLSKGGDETGLCAYCSGRGFKTAQVAVAEQTIKPLPYKIIDGD